MFHIRSRDRSRDPKYDRSASVAGVDLKVCAGKSCHFFGTDFASSYLEFVNFCLFSAVCPKALVRKECLYLSRTRGWKPSEMEKKRGSEACHKVRLWSQPISQPVVELCWDRSLAWQPTAAGLHFPLMVQKALWVVGNAFDCTTFQTVPCGMIQHTGCQGLPLVACFGSSWHRLRRLSNWMPCVSWGWNRCAKVCEICGPSMSEVPMCGIFAYIGDKEAWLSAASCPSVEHSLPFTRQLPCWSLPSSAWSTGLNIRANVVKRGIPPKQWPFIRAGAKQ